MLSKVHLNLASVEGREIFVYLLKNHLACLLAQALSKHAEKFRLRRKS